MQPWKISVGLAECLTPGHHLRRGLDARRRGIFMASPPYFWMVLTDYWLPVSVIWYEQGWPWPR